jgi:hypothetical protein
MRFDSQETDPTFNIRVVKTDAEEFNQSGLNPQEFT